MAIPKSLKAPTTWKELFLQELERLPNVTLAARKARIDRITAYSARKTDPEFALAWDAALDASIQMAEGEVYRRAVHGVLEPVYQGGKKTGSVRRFSDSLLMFMLRAHKPSMYRETTRSEISGPDNTPIKVTQTGPDLSKLDTEELLLLRQISEKIAGVDTEN